MNMVKGTEPDAIMYSVDWVSPEFVVTVTHPDGRILTERYTASHEPRFGPDAVDAEIGEQILERLLGELRKQ